MTIVVDEAMVELLRISLSGVCVNLSPTTRYLVVIVLLLSSSIVIVAVTIITVIMAK